MLRNMLRALILCPLGRVESELAFGTLLNSVRQDSNLYVFDEFSIRIYCCSDYMLVIQVVMTYWCCFACLVGNSWN